MIAGSTPAPTAVVVAAGRFRTKTVLAAQVAPDCAKATMLASSDAVTEAVSPGSGPWASTVSSRNADAAPAVPLPTTTTRAARHATTTVLATQLRTP